MTQSHAAAGNGRPPDRPLVAFLGLGVMGSGMAENLCNAEFLLIVYNRKPGRSSLLIARGAEERASPRLAAENADVIVAMVADDNASRAVWLGEDGALAAAKPGAVLVECSTLSVQWVRRLAEAASAQGCAFLEAPVTGSKSQAASGELLFLVGGEVQTLEQVRPVLDSMGRGVIHLGSHGSGALLKLVNNFLCGVQAASLAEALALIERSGLARDAALAVLTEGAPGSPMIKTLAARMTSRDYSVNFALKLMRKDLDYSITEAKTHGMGLETAMAALNLFSRAEDLGSGNQDLAAVVEALRMP